MKLGVPVHAYLIKALKTRIFEGMCVNNKSALQGLEDILIGTFMASYQCSCHLGFTKHALYIKQGKSRDYRNRLRNLTWSIWRTIVKACNLIAKLNRKCLSPKSSVHAIPHILHKIFFSVCNRSICIVKFLTRGAFLCFFFLV